VKALCGFTEVIPAVIGVATVARDKSKVVDTAVTGRISNASSSSGRNHIENISWADSKASPKKNQLEILSVFAPFFGGSV
jgi:hypothetical protein